MKVGWSASHGEFLIEDYYYFSKLKEYAENDGIEIVQENSFYRLERYDVVVFNYPEISFRLRELGRIRGWLRRGKRIIFASYYNNLDRVSEIINRALARINSTVRLGMDIVVDEKNNISDSRFPVAVWKGRKVVMPCSSSVYGGTPLVRSDRAVFGASEEIGNGKILVIGTCVFWDNYSIDLLSNRKLSLSLLAGDF